MSCSGLHGRTVSAHLSEAFWLVSDPLGTPRMIVGKSGTLASVKRHDYLPFGEELSAGIGGRTTGQGYSGDSVRQHFTGYEADSESGLNFAEARYQSSVQGRFTSVDPLGASASVADPQSFNRYSYVNNNPTNLIDPSGTQAYDASNSYSDAAGSLEGQAFDPNRSHFGGPAVLFAAGLFHDVGAMAASQGGSTAYSGDGRIDSGREKLPRMKPVKRTLRTTRHQLQILVKSSLAKCLVIQGPS